MSDITVTAAKVGLVDPEQAEVIPEIAYEAVTAGQALYRDATTGRMGLLDCNGAAGLRQFRGIAMNPAGAGQEVDVLKKGRVYGFDLSGLSYDALVYGSDTAGAIGDAVSSTLTVNVGRVVRLSDANKTKVLYVEADWLRTWA